MSVSNPNENILTKRLMRAYTICNPERMDRIGMLNDKEIEQFSHNLRKEYGDEKESE